ncbi:MAG: porphobilinogen synthase [Chloroflexi bacterium]|nr:porphobilinogen synthase [Chloroflexota bacterium]MBV9897662.1 porphobilinogen synthase [Chloroflexota bacterium]
MEHTTRAQFPQARPRRLRRTENLRRMVRETHLRTDGFIYPVFVVPGTDVHEEITSMPGVYHQSIDRVVEDAREVADLGIPAMLLFGLPPFKDAEASQAMAVDGIVQQALRAIKRAAPSLVLIADTCLCEYTSHGHCGVLGAAGQEGFIDNDLSLELMSRTAVSQAEAGADIVAPSDMLDGRVGAIRAALDARGLHDTLIMSYAAKYASAFYGPFRDAADSAPQFGDRRGYQMDPPNGREAVREVGYDLAEGADIVMVKPALPYLDVVHAVKTAYPDVPLAAYNVSGEYSMLKAAVANGWLDERRAVMEALTGIVRAGADMIITYYAKDVARWLRDDDTSHTATSNGAFRVGPSHA